MITMTIDSIMITVNMITVTIGPIMITVTMMVMMTMTMDPQHGGHYHLRGGDQKKPSPKENTAVTEEILVIVLEK